MRVLHVHSGNLYGGVETVLTTLARTPGRGGGVASEFALCFQGRLSRELLAGGASVHVLGEVQVRRPFSIMRARRRLRKILERNAFEFVIVHSPWAHALFAPVARRSGVPTAFWLHDVTDGRHWLHRWARRTRPAVVIATSRFVAGLADRVFAGPPVQVVYTPVEEGAAVPPAKRLELRAELDTPHGDVVVLQVGRLERWKGHRLHLQALSLLRKVPGWRYWIVGGAQRPHEREYLQELRDLSVRLGVAERVIFVGERSDVPDLMAAADVFCQPNEAPEPFGRVFVEALAAGLPVVSTRMGGAVEIIDDSCGVLVPPGDAPSLAEALRGLIADPARREALGARGPARARELCDPAESQARLAEVLAAAAPRGAA